MTDVRLRPRFVFEHAYPPERVLSMIGDAIANSSAAATGTVFGSSAVLKVHPDDRHFWSPRLQVSVDPVSTGGSTLHCLFGPHPTVWSMFIALYVAIGFSGAMGMVFGYSQWSIGASADAFWSGPIALVLAAIVYIAGRTGRKLGHDQMRHLRLFLDESLA